MKKGIALMLALLIMLGCMGSAVLGMADSGSLQIDKLMEMSNVESSWLIAESFIDGTGGYNEFREVVNDYLNELPKAWRTEAIDYLVEEGILVSFTNAGKALLVRIQESTNTYPFNPRFVKFSNYHNSFIYYMNLCLEYLAVGNLGMADEYASKANEQISLMQQEMDRINSVRHIWVYLDDQELIFADVAPMIHNDRTMVPLRVIFEAFGADVEWDSETQTVTASLDTTTIQISIDHSVAYKNGEEIALDAPAILTNGRTLVPLRFISESFGASVYWAPETYDDFVLIYRNE